jgi:hypothetical protein
MLLYVEHYFAPAQAHIKCQPFIASSEDHLQSMSLISTVLVLVLGIMLKAHPSLIRSAALTLRAIKRLLRVGRHLPAPIVKCTTRLHLGS